ncbi:MAG: ArsR/SmtB family transcription factor [Luteimonas sp.]
MVEYRKASADVARLDAVFAALSDRTRRDMLGQLAAGERSVGELAAPFSMSLAAVSKHIKVLEAAGLVKREVLGRTHRVHLDPQPLHAGMEWIRHYEVFWSRNLDALAALLRAEGRAATVQAVAHRAAAPRRARKASAT